MRTKRPFIFSAFLCALCVSAVTSSAADDPKWMSAAKTAKPMDAAETRAFIKRLATFAVENHM